jgi:hypothetical protein
MHIKLETKEKHKLKKSQEGPPKSIINIYESLTDLEDPKNKSEGVEK